MRRVPQRLARDFWVQGIVNLWVDSGGSGDPETIRLRICSSAACLRSHLEAGYFLPGLESARTFPTVLLSSEPMSARTKVFADRAERRQEALSLARRLKTTHGSFALACWLM